MKQIQATIIGYNDEPATVFAGYDEETRVLVIGAKVKFRAERRAGCMVVTNDTNIVRDEVFSEDHLRAAIAAFYTLRNGVAADGGSTRLTFADRAMSANPESAIEKDGVTETGVKFRISEGVTNAQMAVLAACLHATRSDVIERTVSFAEQLARLSSGGIMTI